MTRNDSAGLGLFDAIAEAFELVAGALRAHSLAELANRATPEVVDAVADPPPPGPDQGSIALDKPVFTAGEVAELLGIHRGTVYQYVRRGEIAASHFGGGQVRIPIDEVRRLLTSDAGRRGRPRKERN